MQRPYGGALESGASVVVLPEALPGGYPKGSTFGTYLGLRLAEGREEYARYFRGAIDVPGPETEELAGLAQRTSAHLVVGVIERAGSTLYCTALFLSPEVGLVGKHRKLMATGTVPVRCNRHRVWPGSRCPVGIRSGR